MSQIDVAFSLPPNNQDAIQFRRNFVLISDEENAKAWGVPIGNLNTRSTAGKIISSHAYISLKIDVGFVVN